MSRLRGAIGPNAFAIGVLSLLVVLGAACGATSSGAASASPGASATPTPVPRATSGAMFADAACASLRTLVKAVGNPDTASGSDLTRAFEAAITQRDTARADAVAQQLAAILADARVYAAAAAGWEPGAEAAGNVERLIRAYEAMIEAMRAAAGRGLTDAKAAGQQAFLDAGAMEAWQGLLHGQALPSDAAQALGTCRFWEGPTPEPGAVTPAPASVMPAPTTAP